MSRVANSVAHTCAREAMSLEAISLDFDVTYVYLIEVVQSDLIPPSY